MPLKRCTETRISLIKVPLKGCSISKIYGDKDASISKDEAKRSPSLMKSFSESDESRMARSTRPNLPVRLQLVHRLGRHPSPGIDDICVRGFAVDVDGKVELKMQCTSSHQNPAKKWRTVVRQ